MTAQNHIHHTQGPRSGGLFNFIDVTPRKMTREITKLIKKAYAPNATAPES